MTLHPAPPRIAPLEGPFTSEMEERLRRRMRRHDVPPLALFRLLVRDAALSAAMDSMGRFHLQHEPGRYSSIEPREREIVIHRVCARCRCEYEWGVHVAGRASEVGLTPQQVAATVQDGAVAEWSERDCLLLELVDALHDHADVSDELWVRLAVHWSETQLLQLFVLAGWYHAIAYVANAARLPLEPWAARFPPQPT